MYTDRQTHADDYNTSSTSLATGYNSQKSLPTVVTSLALLARKGLTTE